MPYVSKDICAQKAPNSTKKTARIHGGPAQKRLLHCTSRQSWGGWLKLCLFSSETSVSGMNHRRSLEREKSTNMPRDLPEITYRTRSTACPAQDKAADVPTLVDQSQWI
jgi:hypothetical protein